VYVGVDVSSDNRAPLGWLRKAYGLFSRNYKKHIQKLYLIHPTKFTRVCLKLFKPFISEKFWRKLVTVDDVAQIHQFISPEQLRLPDACYDVPMRKGQKIVLFGASLERTVKESSHASGVAAPLVAIFSHIASEDVLQVEGLFRMSGSETVMRQLRQDLEAEISVDWTVQDPHSCTGVLKQFIRELRVTVFPPSSFETLVSFFAITQDNEFARQVAVHIDALPPPHRDFSRYLFSLLALVAKNAEENKMSPQNLAVCLAPHLLSNPKGTHQTTLRDTSTQTNITRRIIEKWPAIAEMNPDLDVNF
jgi:Rho GTPase-activating protein 1